MSDGLHFWIRSYRTDQFQNQVKGTENLNRNKIKKSAIGLEITHSLTKIQTIRKKETPPTVISITLGQITT